MIPTPRLELPAAVGFLVMLALASAAPAVADEPIDENTSYSYVRTLEGRATLASEGRGPGEEAGANQPLQQGDTVRVEAGARVEIVLADRNLLRLAGDTTVTLARVAFSADRDDRTTRLDLDEGELLLLVGEDALGDELPEIRTPGGTVYVHEPGQYRLRASSNGGLELLVREGYAEILGERGSTVVRAGEEARTRGDEWSSVEVGDAGPLDALERWGERLDEDARVADSRTLYVEPQYRYAAAPLTNYGSWVYFDSTWCWRPRVTVDWRPYWNGRWVWTPSGLTWVSAEPWGWLPYHYGTWTMAAGYGWCWRPGRVYSPAWVYWSIGPRWTGWCPVGYYTDYYRNHWYNGFRFGVYGWAGGSWSIYSDWNFCPTPRVFERDGRQWHRTGSHLGRLEGNDLPHGVLTTDTRGLDRRDWMSAVTVVDKLAGRRAGNGEQLPVVTDFVARKRELSPEIERAVVAERTASARRADTPLGPRTSSGGSARPQVDSDTGESARWRSNPSVHDVRSSVPRSRKYPSPSNDGTSSRRGDDDVAIASRGTSQGRGEIRSVPAVPRGVPQRAEPGDDSARSSRGRGDDEVDANDRQGWQRRTPPVLSGGPAAGNGRPTTSRRPDDVEEPVSRVIGGMRRGAPEEPSSSSSRVSPYGSGRGEPQGSSRYGRPDDDDRPGAAQPRYLPPGRSPSGSSPSVRSEPYARSLPTVRPQAPGRSPSYSSPSVRSEPYTRSSPTVRPQAPGRSAPAVRSTPAAPGGGRPTASAPPSGGSATNRGQSSSTSTSRGSSGSSQKSTKGDAPPPQRGGSKKQERDHR
ncbi:MAG TPA: DUF6600 domain-containing protein [Thermoanaerobaculia bacterium]|nr:DUF6600 domain-containing protein [Thermoanaerobaculia bacterium]